MDTTSCQIAITGREGSGKTTLARELFRALSAAESPGPDCDQEPRPKQARSCAVELGGSASSRAVFRRGWMNTIGEQAVPIIQTLGKVLPFRLKKRRPRLGVCDVPSPQSKSGAEGSWRLIDGEGSLGLGVIALRYAPDVVLYVIRLDDSRSTQDDALALHTLTQAFCEKILQRTLIVFTHGHSLPPEDLTYAEYVRGRHDALRRMLTVVSPPIPRPDEVQGRPRLLTLEQYKTVCDQADNILNDNELRTRLGLPPIRGNRRTNEPREEPRPQARLPWWKRNRIIRKIVETPFVQTVDGIPVVEPDQGMEPDIVMLTDPPALESVVVELSEHCPRNEAGEKILPDGTVCLSELIAAIQRRHDRATRESWPPLRSKFYQGQVQDPRHWRGRFLVWLRRESLQGVLSIILRFSLLSAAVRGYIMAEKALSQYIQRRRERSPDIVVGISDEEFARLTVRDVEDSPPIGDDYEKAEEYFFGWDEDGGDAQARPQPGNGN